MLSKMQRENAFKRVSSLLAKALTPFEAADQKKTFKLNGFASCQGPFCWWWVQNNVRFGGTLSFPQQAGGSGNG